MSGQYDAVIVGAGHNGLIVAAYLAKAGLKVCVLEKNPWIGGSTSTTEATLPGFKHDLGGTGHIMIQGNPVIANDELGLKSTYGLEYVFSEHEFHTGHLFDDGTEVLMGKSVEATCEQIATYSQHDADAYQRFIEFTMPMLPLLGSGMFNAPPAFGQMMAQLDSSPIGRDLVRHMLMSAWDIATQWFEHPKTRIMLSKYAAEPLVLPYDKGSGMYLLLMVPGSHLNEWGLPKGGSVGLPNALRRCIEAHGGEVVLDSPVTTITTSGGRATGVTTAAGDHYAATRAVIANVDPRVSMRWLDQPLGADLERKLDGILPASFSGLMQAIALDEAPRYRTGPGSATCIINEPLPTDVDDYLEQFHALSRGRVSMTALNTSAVVPTIVDPTRAPDGKQVLYLWHYMPYDLADGGHDRWDQIGQQVADDALDYYCGFTTNITPDALLGRHLVTPNDYPKFNNNIVDGQLLGPAPVLSQLFAYRPIPELGQFRTPIESLYLAGQALHPAGSITGGGRATAQVVMGDLGIDFDDVVMA